MRMWRVIGFRKMRISSRITLLFQVAMIFQLFGVIVVALTSLLSNDWITIAIFSGVAFLGVIIIRIMGVTRLTTVIKKEDHLVIGRIIQEHISLDSIVKISKTFFQSDFPYKVTFTKNGASAHFYFLPKTHLSDIFVSENATISDLKKSIILNNNKSSVTPQ